MIRNKKVFIGGQYVLDKRKLKALLRYLNDLPDLPPIFNDSDKDDSQRVSSPIQYDIVRIDKEGVLVHLRKWVWRVLIVLGWPVVPMKERIEIAIIPYEDEHVADQIDHLFWRARSLMERFYDYLTGFFDLLKGILEKIFAMLKKAADAAIPQRMIVLKAPQIVVTATTPKVETGEATSASKVETVGAVVKASSSPMSRDSLLDDTWLGYFELNPDKASSPIQQAIEQEDFGALVRIQQNKDLYPQLNTMIDRCMHGNCVEIN